MEDFEHEVYLPQIQSLERKMAKQLLQICDSYGLKIWACYGTLLGCVRHKGFIPWDDDMDFVMLRNDYDRLREIIRTIPNLIPSDSPITFDIQREIVIKLRYEGTAMMAPHVRLSDKLNQSCWIDVFCLDEMPQKGFSNFEYKKIRSLIKIKENALLMSYATSPGIKHKLLHFVCQIISIVYGGENLYRDLRKSLQIENYSGLGGAISEKTMIANIMLFAKSPKFDSYAKIKKYEKEWFEETVMLPFDDMELPCPRGYYEFLNTQYGNWQIPIKNASMHTGVYIDMHRSYRDVITERLQLIPKWKRFFYIH